MMQQYYFFRHGKARTSGLHKQLTDEGKSKVTTQAKQLEEGNTKVSKLNENEVGSSQDDPDAHALLTQS